MTTTNTAEIADAMVIKDLNAIVAGMQNRLDSQESLISDLYRQIMELRAQVPNQNKEQSHD